MSAPRRYLMFSELPYSFEIMRPLQAAARRRGEEVAWFLDGPDAAHLHEGERLLKSMAEVKAFAPHAVFVPGNQLPPSFPGLKVQIFHGFAIEKKGHFRLRGMFDLFCTFGPLTTEPFERLAEKHRWFKVVETGWPKVDPLFDAGVAPVSGGPKRILYAPTFSRSLTSAPALAEEIAGIVARRDWQWTVKFHPKMATELAAPLHAIKGANFEIASTPELLPLLHQADVLLTDTSSAAVEFMLLDKPVVAFRNRMPGPHLVNLDDPQALEDCLSTVLGGSDPSEDARRRFTREMHPYSDGRSSERVLDAVEQMLVHGRRGLKRKPWTPVRQFKYWRKFS